MTSRPSSRNSVSEPWGAVPGVAQPHRIMKPQPFSTALLAVILAGAPSLRAQPSESEDTHKALQAQKERAGSIADRGAKPHYTQKFDLSGLPHYRPSEKFTGWLRLHGNNYIADGNLGKYWLEEFAKYQPGIRISVYL